MYLFHSWRRLEAGTSITKGYERSLSAQGWERMTKGHTPGLEAFRGFLLTTCFWEQGLLFHNKTPFRDLPKLCYVLGGGNCILCLNALMFIEKGLHACLLYALFPETIKLCSWIINFVSPLEAVPECSFQSVVLQALHMSIEAIMPSNHLILWHPLLLLPPIPPSIRVCSNESTLCTCWPKFLSSVRSKSKIYWAGL